jgi:predicted glycosyltransferase
MKIFFDLNHPVHYHTLKKLIARLQTNGHFCFVSLRDKDVLLELVKKEGIIKDWKVKGKGSQTKTGRIFQLFFWNFINLLWTLKFKPDLFIGFASPYMSLASFVMRKPLILLDDTEIDALLQKVYLPFVSKLITPSCFNKDLGKKQVRENFLKELSYLIPVKKQHPNYQHNILVRFTSVKALHDSKCDKLSDKSKKELVEKLSKFGNVYISSEDCLSKSLSTYELKVPHHEIHDFMQNQMDVFIGESATMAAEAAVLGKVSVYIDMQTRGYINYLEHAYGLVKRFSSLHIPCLLKYVKNEIDDNKLLRRQQKALNLKENHIDLTDYLYDEITNGKQIK